MLKNLSPLLNADLLGILAAMGHGDRIAVVDANYPAASAGPRVCALAGADLNAAVAAIVSVMPVDDSDAPLTFMVPKEGELLDVHREAVHVVQVAAEPAKARTLDRFGFYTEARSAFAIVTTSERRPYGNVLIVKGVV